MIQLISGSAASRKFQALAVPVFSDATVFEDPVIESCIREAKGLSEFHGKEGENVILYQSSGIAASRIIFIGVGSCASATPETFRSFAGRAVTQCRKLKVGKLAVAVPDTTLPVEANVVIESLATGALLANYRYNRYKTEIKNETIASISLLSFAKKTKKMQSSLQRVTDVCKATLLARNWINTPPNHKAPEKLARDMAEKAKESGLQAKVLGIKSLRRQGFGAMLSVAAGSRNPPALVILSSGPTSSKTTAALIGKGVTFDSGGINIKVSKKSLQAMKSDMSGAAAVAATMLVASKIRPDWKFVGVIPLVENMPSGSAAKPGDVIAAYNGTTIEIGNTDAEGRLILADAIAYAVRRFQPDLMIDVATLTGACAMALGEKFAGVFSNDMDLARNIVQAGSTSGERCWHLPMPEDYRTYLSSNIADICNMSSSRLGGAITAALFLQEFAGNSKWAHIDIAGPAYADKASAYCGPGGAGFGVRLIAQFLADRS